MPVSHRNLLQPVSLAPDGATAWKIADHPHTVVGTRLEFEVRVYHDSAWAMPYYVTIVSIEHGWIMEGGTAPTAAAAEAEALDMLASLDGNSAPVGTA